MSFIVRNITSGPPVAVELGDMGITIGIPAAEVTDVTTVADVAGSLGGTFFTLNDIVTKYYVWYDVDNGSADPTPAGRTSIEVDIATNDTANTVASNTQAAVDAVADFGASVSTNVVTITNATQGFVADARDGSAATGFTLNVTTQGDGTADFTSENPSDVVSSTDLIDAIGATDLAVLDPLDETQLSAADSLIVVSVHNDPHFRSGPGVGDMAVVQARRSTNFSLTSTPTDITLDVTDVENDTAVLEHDNTNTEQIDIGETGPYLITYGCEIDWDDTGGDTTDVLTLRIFKNGTTEVPGSPLTSGPEATDDAEPYMQRTIIAELASGDEISLQASITGVGTNALFGNTIILNVVRLKGTKGDTGPAGAGSTVNVQEEGVNVTGTPHDTLNFVGTGVTATDGGAGVATITIPDDLIVSFVIEDPTTADSGMLQHKFARAVTITRISASTDVGTVTIQFDERVEATPNTSGTDVMTAVLIADTNTEATTAFANANIAADAVLNLDIDAVATSPGVVRIHVEYRPQ